MTAAGVRLERLSKRFHHAVKGDRWVVRDVTLDVRPGELLTLLGPSGCGKTTTLRMIAGFEEPDAGRVFIGGDDVTRLMANRRNIGFVFQNYALFPHLTVFENVAYGLRIRGVAGAEVAQRVGEVLAMVGLERYERQQPHQLSGGEQQRVALARAVVIRPRVLLFDEPLSNLDLKLRVQMREEIRRLQKELSITAIYVTHDQEEAMAVSDHIAVMNEGTLVQEGSAEDLYHRPASAFVAHFIGRVNLLAGEVVEAGGGIATVAVGDARLRIATERTVRVGEAVRLVVRPETVGLHPEATGARGDISGTVVARTFLGEKVDYQVQVGEQLILVTRYNSGNRGLLTEGQHVRLEVSEDCVRLLAVTE
jgi:spermidine/putrescine ABC transporter ATP-binding subunit